MTDLSVVFFFALKHALKVWLWNSSISQFKVHGNTTVEEVILVGQIMKMDLTTQSVSIVLCDTTSKVSVEMYSSDDDFKDMMDKLQRLMYRSLFFVLD